MWPNAVSALVAIFCLATVLEATYLDRPLWVAQKGKPLSVAFANEEFRLFQAQAERQETDQRLLIPEPFNPSRSGAEAPTRPANLQWPSQSIQQQSALEHSKPFPINSFDHQSWNFASTPEDSQKQYHNQEEQQTKPDKTGGTSPLATRPSDGQPPVQLHQSKPGVFVPNLQKPAQYDLVRPDTDLGYQAQRSQEDQQSYNSYQLRPEAYKPSPSFSVPDYQIPYLLPSQPLFQPSLLKPADMQPSFVKPEREISYQAQHLQEAQHQQRPEAYQASPSFSVPNYQIAPKPEPQYQPVQSKPERFVPNRPHLEPILPTEQQAALQWPERELLYQVERPQESQQGYNSYPARPEIYKPNVNFPEPGFQMPYVSQPNQPIKPEQDAPWEREKQLGHQAEQGFPTHQYQPPALHPYQSLTNGPQASLPTEQDERDRDHLSSYQPPAKPSYPLREPVDPKPSQTQPIRQPNPQLPRNQPQRPVRPAEREQEQFQYQPNRSPPTSWESQYQPEQSIPNQQKPTPIAKPPQGRPNIRQPPAFAGRPETYYEDDEDEELVKYEMPVTRLDARCPRDDDPAKPVHFPSVSSCVKFQKCFNGIAYEMSCPPGLQFDAKHSRCDYPARANCAL